MRNLDHFRPQTKAQCVPIIAFIQKKWPIMCLFRLKTTYHQRFAWYLIYCYLTYLYIGEVKKTNQGNLSAIFSE
jgi:hypothetical protein